MQSLLDVDAAIAELQKDIPEPPSLNFSEVKCGYRMGWSFALSLISHQIAVVALLFLSILSPVLSRHFSSPRLRPIRIDDGARLVYLPIHGGGSEGLGEAQASPVQNWTGGAARSKRGVIQRAPQPIVSNPPAASNSNQTLLQPQLPNPTVLPTFVPLPNLVQSAENKLSVPRDVIIVKPETRSHPVAAIEPPNLKLPAPASAFALPSAEPELPVHKVLKVTSGTTIKPAAAPSLEAPKLTLKPETDVPSLATAAPMPRLGKVEQSSVPPQVDGANLPVRGSDQHSLLALSPVPAAPDVRYKLPLGESRGSFAVSPDPVVAKPDTASDGLAEGGSVGTGKDAAAPDTAGEKTGASGATSRLTANASSGGNGSKGMLGSGGTDPGSGLGSRSGVGVGEGSGASLASGAGAGTGLGRGTFPGITIQRGQSGTGSLHASLAAAGNLHASLAPAGSLHASLAPQTAPYGMTVVSTAHAGGGLPDLGIFSNEKVYTIYLDMRTRASDPPRSWTLQYAPIRSASTNAASPSGSYPSSATLTPPYAITKENPQFPAEVMQKHAQKLMIVSAIMTAEGQLAEMLVVQTPDDAFTGPLLEALNKCRFKPAEIDGRPVALKILLGIPLSLP